MNRVRFLCGAFCDSNWGFCKIACWRCLCCSLCGCCPPLCDPYELAGRFLCEAYGNPASFLCTSWPESGQDRARGWQDPGPNLARLWQDLGHGNGIGSDSGQILPVPCQILARSRRSLARFGPGSRQPLARSWPDSGQEAHRKLAGIPSASLRNRTESS